MNKNARYKTGNETELYVVFKFIYVFFSGKPHYHVAMESLEVITVRKIIYLGNRNKVE